ncbi:MAG: dicarboxylate/amino acid:cation symporter [Bryobacterales bacterium]|nr:dicarboxylate/amino acid:cation symporter [Bryobacterales bacterium]
MRRISLASWVLIAIAAGLFVGFVFPDAARHFEIATSIFLRLIRSVIAPVLFGVLVSAAGRARSANEFGSLALRAVIYFELVTASALLIGWVAVAIAKPGSSFHYVASAAAATAPPVTDLITAAFPTSILDAMARGDILQIVLFTSLFAAACTAIGERSRAVTRFAEALTAVSFQYTRYIMYLAPLAVFASIANTLAQNGATALGGLANFVVTAWMAQVFFALLVFGGSLWFARIPLLRFLEHAEAPVLVGFATTSSAAALPQTLESLQAMGVPPRVVGIVTPLSLSLNMTGSCVHLAMGAMFAAQTAGLALTLPQQLAILGVLKLTSKGVAGIPRANLVILSGLFATFHLPAEVLPVLLGVDALIDPVRTSVNVLGHFVAAPVIARLDRGSASAPLSA